MLALPKQAWRTVTWREGSASQLSSRFARERVRVGYNKLVAEKLSPEWLLIKWPEGEAAPTKYWRATLPKTIRFERLVDLAKLCLRIDRDYKELKQEVGFGRYEGRSDAYLLHHAQIQTGDTGVRRALVAFLCPRWIEHDGVALKRRRKSTMAEWFRSV
ncbi:hypothetical protein [Bradyrhizobium sp. USDA 336]|uniref:hypothetical protein n=1 Tax=Bradyrhizobium sp. USDA 336 TaxID=3156311 RepID=UPI003836851A